MTRPPTTPRTTRRAIALLIVLAALVVGVTACAALARLATTARLQELADRRARIADDLLAAAEEPILHWLTNESASAVLPPDARSPELPVLDDAWKVAQSGSLKRTAIRVRITAWDQRGMAPLPALARGSPLRLALPDPLVNAVDRAALGPRDTPGLDLFQTPTTPTSPTSPTSPTGLHRPSVFPLPSPTETSHHASPNSGPNLRPPALPTASPHAAPALGALIATHNPPPADDAPHRAPHRAPRRAGRRGEPPGAININTAPMPMVEAAMRMAGRSGADHIAAQRAEGRPARSPGGATSEPDALAPALVGTSDAWAFRIDIAVDNSVRSWWAVYTLDPGASSRANAANGSAARGATRGGGWWCVQRIRIDR